MEKEDQLRLLRKSFSDISRGYSVALLEGNKVFIRHLSHHEQVDLDVLHKSFMLEGAKEGLPREATVLKRLKEEGEWTDKDEKDLEQHKLIIERLTEGKKVIFRKSDLETQIRLIEEEQRKYNEKMAVKLAAIGTTAELYADRKLNEYYIVESFFMDSACTKKVLTEDVFEHMTDQEVQDMIRLYNDEMEVVSDRNVKYLAIQDFFQVYWSMSPDNLYHFFGKPISHLTYFQVKLGSYARMFRDILSKADGLPDDVKNDPDKLLDYVRVGENAREKMENAKVASKNDVVASTMVGAKAEEYKAIGVKSDSSVNLSDELKKNAAQGKKGLDMHDLMKLMGS